MKDSATRPPSPVMMKAMALSGSQPGRSMISWMIDDRSEVCSVPPTEVQADGAQATTALVAFPVNPSFVVSVIP